MANEDFHAKYRAHQAHMAAVPLAIQHLRGLLTDFDGSDIPDGQAPLDGVTAGELRTVLNEVERLQAALKQAHQDMREEQREFQREARDIAAEARWQGQEETRGGHY